MKFQATLIFLLVSSTISLIQGQIIENYNPEIKTDYSFVPYCKDKLCGYMDRQGNLKIKADYDEVSFFNERGFAQIKKYGLYGIIDKTGKEIIKPMSSRVLSKAKNLIGKEEMVLENAFFAINTKAKEWIYFTDFPNTNASPIYYAEDDKYQYKVSNSFYSTWSYPHFLEGLRRAVSKDGTCNFIDTNGNRILKSNIPFGTPSKDAIYTINNLDKIGILGLDGKQIMDNQFSYLEHPDEHGYKLVKSKSYYGLVDANNTLVIDTVQRSLMVVNKNRFVIKNDNNLSQLVDLELSPILPKTYDHIRHVKEDKYIVQKNKRYFLINEGDEILAGPFGNLQAPSFLKSNFLYSTSGDSTYFLQTNGEIIFTSDLKYEIQEGNKKSHFILSNREHGSLLINKAGNILLEPGYKTIRKTKFDDEYIVSKGNKMGIFSESLNWIIPLAAQNISSFTDSKYPNIPKIRIDTQNESTIYTNDFSNKVVEEKKYNNWSTEKKFRDDFIEIKFIDGRELIFPNDKKASIEYNSKHAYLKKRFENGNTIVYNENMESLLPEGFYLSRDHKLKDEVYFIVQNKEREYGMSDMEGNWIFPPKQNQRIQNLDDKYWINGNQSASSLFNANFEKITAKEYKNFILTKNKLIIAKNIDNKTLDILNEKGEVISDAVYTSSIRNTIDFLVLEKSKSGEIQSCQIDESGNEVICYPYADFFIPKNHNYIIAKDLHDFGVVDKEGIEKIPFKYKTIQYIPEINSYLCKQEDYSSEIYDANFNKLNIYAKGLYQIKKLDDRFYYLQGSDVTVFFDNTGQFLGTTDNANHGKIIGKQSHLNQGLIWLYKTGASSFYDIKTNRVLSPI